MIMIKKKYLPGIAVLLLFAVLAIISLYDQNQIEQNIEVNKQVVVAKIYETASNRSFDLIYYEYYYNGKRNESSENVDANVQKLENRFFEVYISTEHPEYSRIQLDREVTDTVRIRAAGFELE